MNDEFTSMPAKYVVYTAALLIALTHPVFGQQAGPARQPSNKTNEERLRQQDMSRREYQLRNLGTQPPNASDRKQLEALMRQTEQDFNRILMLHNQIVRATSADQNLDYHFVSEAAAEINKRASRLQTTLALHESEAGHKSRKEGDDLSTSPLKEALLMLCRQIKSFVTNPVIETPGTVNAEHLEKARHDLAGIVKLSVHIKKDADRLGKTVK